MKLTGTKLIALAIGFTTAAPAFAADEPQITAFTSGTPAKAEEVNANFNASINYTTRSADELTLKIESVEKADEEATATQALQIQGLATRVNALDGESGTIAQLTSKIEAVEKADSDSTADLLAQIEALKTRLSALDGEGGKTEEFTQVFNELDDRVDVLEEKVLALESQSNTGDGYNIAVWGDCDGECTDENLIGYAKDMPGLYEMSSDGGTGIHLMNQQHGLIALNQILKYEGTEASLAGYSLSTVEPISGLTVNSITLYYQDNLCTGTPYYGKTGEGIIAITEQSKLQKEQIVTGNHNQLIYVTDSSQLTASIPTLYYFNYEGVCSEFDGLAQGNARFIIPLVEVTQETHGLKSKYSNIQINGFRVLN